MTLQLIGGLFLPAAFLLSFLKWQRLRFWRDHSSVKDLDLVAHERTLSTVLDTIMTVPLEALAVVRMDLCLVLVVALVAVLGVHALEARRSRLYAMGAAQLAVIAWCQLEVVSFFFFERTGTNLDLSLAGLFITRIDELHHLVSAEGKASVPALLAMFLAFFLVLPWLLGRLFGNGMAQHLQRPPKAVFGAGGLAVIVLSMIGFWPSEGELPESVLSNSTVHMVETALRGTEGPNVQLDELDDPPFFAQLKERDDGQDARSRVPNIVLIILESTRPDDMSIYAEPSARESGDPAPTTPFLESIADESLVFERHYTTVPHTSKALVSVLCGIYPHWRSITTEALPVSLPARCLPEMLARQGYATSFFQAATAHFEDRDLLVDNMGFESLFAAEDVATDDFEVVNYFGYEEDALLEPSFEWADEHADQPFLLTYLTVMSHSPYTAPGVDSQGRPPEQVRQDYRDTIRYADRFVERIFGHFRDTGLAEDTIFVVLSDHGEAFGEHGIYSHNGVLYEEGVRSAMMIHAPGDPVLRGRREHLSSHLDVVPTVADAAGFSVEGASYPGRALIEPPPEDSPRQLMLHGWYDNRVLGSVEQNHKFIY
ncbi:MAG: LTA synthase family protein, partial [Persicimonas sp.]